MGRHEPRVIDAEYEIVRPASPPKPWNGVGLPPDWREFNLLAKLAYLAIYGGLMGGVWWTAKTLVRLLWPH